MPVNVISISHTEAAIIVAAVIQKATSDGGSPVAVAVVDHAGRLIAFTAMDNVMPASIKLAQNKAYSAVIGKRDTLYWACMAKNTIQLDFNMRNWTDENFTGFTGGITILIQEQVIGAVGVSGRKGKQDIKDTILQDHELAELGRAMIAV
ncbi:MAG: heme-binding protein [Ferruginibacter sp.]